MVMIYKSSIQSSILICIALTHVTFVRYVHYVTCLSGIKGINVVVTVT